MAQAAFASGDSWFILKPSKCQLWYPGARPPGVLAGLVPLVPVEKLRVLGCALGQTDAAMDLHKPSAAAVGLCGPTLERVQRCERLCLALAELATSRIDPMRKASVTGAPAALRSGGS